MTIFNGLSLTHKSDIGTGPTTKTYVHKPHDVRAQRVEDVETERTAETNTHHDSLSYLVYVSGVYNERHYLHSLSNIYETRVRRE